MFKSTLPINASCFIKSNLAQSCCIDDVVLGVDPGAKGAIAVVSVVTHDLIELIDMPSYRINSKDSAAHGKLRVSPLGLARKLQKYSGARCCIEKVGSRPGNNIVSTFAFGQAFGIVLGVCAALGMHTCAVRPQEWIKNFQSEIQDGTDKNQHRECAKTHFQLNVNLFKRIADDGRADAALIALYYINNISKYQDSSDIILENALSW